MEKDTLDDMISTIKGRNKDTTKPSFPRMNRGNPQRKANFEINVENYVNISDDEDNGAAVIEDDDDAVIIMPKDAEAEKKRRLFDGMTITFLPAGMELSLKRIGIFTQQIEKEGGKVYKLDELRFVPFDMLPPLLTIICSRAMNSEIIQQTIMKKITKYLTYEVLSCEWVSECLRLNSLVPKTTHSKSHAHLH